MDPTEPIDSSLRQSLATETAPTLSPNFQQQLTLRLQPRRLEKKQRRFLIAYALTGLTVSVGVLRAVGFSGGFTLLCVLAPLIIVIVALRPYFRES